MFTYYHRSLKEKKITKQQKKRVGSWIVAEKTTPQELEKLNELHGFDLELLEDASDDYEVPRFEAYEGTAYFFTRYPRNTVDSERSTAPVLCAIKPDYILTITKDESPMFISWVLTSEEYVTTQRVKLFFGIIENMLYEYNRSLSTIRKNVTKYFGKVHSIRERDMEHFIGMENTVSEYISALDPTRSAMDRFLRSNVIKLHPDDEAAVADLLLEINQLSEEAINLQKTIRNIREGYSTILANRLNKTIQFLTVMTVTLSVPMLVSSIFGMNVWIPFGDTDPMSFAYAIITILISTTIAGLFFFKQ